MKNTELRIIKTRNSFSPLREFKGVLVVSFTLLCVAINFAQVSATVDSTSIDIGEEIRYKMLVDADSTQIVVFPEGKTFMPLEVIDSYKIDTTQKGKRLSLIKEYALTQFDSGHYTIPRQKVLIGDKVFFTDSLKVEVKDVLVDTTKQKMYAIKPLTEVDASLFNWKHWIWWILGGILLAGLLAFLIFKGKKRIEAKKNKLPPYERAMLALRHIDESNLLEQESHKEYYTLLSDTARKYIDEEVYDHAMESTTDELIAKLDEEIRTGSLNLDKGTIEELKTVLKTADMAKFAKSKPDIGTAKGDRGVIERVINETKEAIPELTEEELLADEEYRKLAIKKAQRKKILLGSAAGVGIIAITFGAFVYAKGYNEVMDTIFGHPTKKLAETEWISSSYGSPAVAISTPQVLIRNKFQLTGEQNQILKGDKTFVYGSMSEDFYIAISTVKIEGQKQQDVKKALEGVVESTVASFEAQGAKNITIKDEEYETLQGVSGLKVFGEFRVKDTLKNKTKKSEYQMLYFAEESGLQQILVMHNKEDRYAKDVAQRIINSVELKNAK